MPPSASPADPLGRPGPAGRPLPAGPAGPAEEPGALALLGSVPYGRVATSLRAMPFLAPARHVLADGGVVLRMHRGFGHHRACHGAVIAYGADNFGSGEDLVWSVQVTGTARVVEPTERELALFGPEPRRLPRIDGAPFDPVYLRVEPRFVTAHTLDHPGVSGERHTHHTA